MKTIQVKYGNTEEDTDTDHTNMALKIISANGINIQRTAHMLRPQYSPTKNTVYLNSGLLDNEQESARWILQGLTGNTLKYLKVDKLTFMNSNLDDDFNKNGRSIHKIGLLLISNHDHRIEQVRLTPQQIMGAIQQPRIPPTPQWIKACRTATTETINTAYAHTVNSYHRDTDTTLISYPLYIELIGVPDVLIEPLTNKYYGIDTMP